MLYLCKFLADGHFYAIILYMDSKQGNKMKIGSTVRVGGYSVAAGGMIWGDTGVILQLFAAVAVVDFGNGKIKKVCRCNLAVV